MFKGVAHNFCLFGYTVCAVLLVHPSVRLVDSVLSLLEDEDRSRFCVEKVSCVSFGVLGGNTTTYSVNLKQQSVSCKDFGRWGVF